MSGFFSKAGAKIDILFLPTKFFYDFFQYFFQLFFNSLIDNGLKIDFFFWLLKKKSTNDEILFHVIASYQ